MSEERYRITTATGHNESRGRRPSDNILRGGSIAVKSRPPTREEMNDVAELAKAFVKANKNRNETSENATLGEEDALFMLRWKINKIAKEMGATRAI